MKEFLENRNCEFWTSVLAFFLVETFIVEEFDGKFEKGFETLSVVVFFDQFIETEGKHESKLISEDFNLGFREFSQVIVSECVLPRHPVEQDAGTKFITVVYIYFLFF